MRILDGRTFLSGSNLKRSMGCAHAAILVMAPALGTGPEHKLCAWNKLPKIGIL